MKTVSKVSLKRGLLISIGISVVSILFILALSRNDFEIESLQRIKPEYLLLGLSVTVAAWYQGAQTLFALSSAWESNRLFSAVRDLHVCGLRITCDAVYLRWLASAGVLMHKEGQPIGRSSAVSIIDSALTTALLILLGPAYCTYTSESENTA